MKKRSRVTTPTILLLAVVSGASAGGGVPAATDEIVVSAAASLRTALSEAVTRYETTRPGTKVLLNSASSGVLARQIEQGAPADLFLSASPVEVERLSSRGHLWVDSRTVFASNRLVVVTSTETRAPGDVEGLAAPRFRRIAIGNPSTVPAGRYAKQSLQTLGVWTAVEDRLVLAENVRQVLDYVARGEVDAGLVYATDARLLPGKVTEGPVAPAASHAAIVYVGAVPKGAPHPAMGRDFLEFLVSDEGRAILARHGFLDPG